MENELIEKLQLYKDTIVFTLTQSMKDKKEEDIMQDVKRSFNNIDNILKQFNNDENYDRIIQIILEIQAELRSKLIEVCQKKASQIEIFGLENIELFTSVDFKRIVFIDNAIELLKEKIEEIKNMKESQEVKDQEVEDKGKKLYIYTAGAIRDLKSLPNEFYKDVKETIDRMQEGNYVGKENRCKVMHNDKLNNSIEHRGNNKIRIYENLLKTDNIRDGRIIKAIEQKLGLSIHFVYKIECKKCMSTNGLDEQREKRYKNENKNVIALLKKLKENIKNKAIESKEKIDELLEKKKNTNEEKRYKVIGLCTINEYLHKEYNIEIFDGFKDPDISETEISKENAEEYERCKINKRVLKYIATKDLEDLLNLSLIFNEIESDYIEDENLSKVTKEIIKKREKDRIFCIVMHLLAEMTLEDLKKTEKDIIMLLDYKDEYLAIKKAKEREKIYG